MSVASQFNFSQADKSGATYAEAANAIATALNSVLTRTSDTGQTSTFASSDPDGVKYQVFKFTDSLQSTNPVYIRVNFYCQVAAEYFPTAIGIQVGTSTDGGGNINGSQFSPLCILVNGQFNSSEHQFGYVSGDTNRIGMAIGEGPDIFSAIFFNIERTKDLAGNDTNEGIIFQCTSPFISAYGGVNCQPSEAVNGLQQAAVVNMVIPFSGAVAGHNTSFVSAYNNGKITMAVGTQVGTNAVVPFCFRPYNPGYGILMYFSSDFPVYSTQSIAMTDGNNHTFLALQQTNRFFTNPYGLPASILMRFE